MYEDYIHKSGMLVYLACPRRYYYEFIEKRQYERSISAQLGARFHDFAEKFFDFVERSKLERLVTFKETREYFNSLVEEDKSISGMQYNFVSFEAKRWVQLRNWWLWFPVARELRVINDEMKMIGKIDRIDRTNDEMLVIVEYKTGKRRQLSKIRKELAFYWLLLQGARGLPPEINPKRVKYIAMYNPSLNSVWYEELKKRTVTALKKSIKKFREGLNREDFETNPGEQCMWCPFWELCEEEVRKSGVEVKKR